MNFAAMNGRVFKSRVCLGGCALAAFAVAAYALLVVQPLVADNAVLRARAAELAVLSAEIGELGELLVSLRHERDEGGSAYQGMLQSLRGWQFKVHAYLVETAVQTGLKVTAMEWAAAAPVTPAFEADPHQRWLRTEVFISLTGAWRAHRDFAHRLSRCDCLVQVMEEEVSASAGADKVEAAMSLSIYYPAEGARV